jgi:hypothetical protein
MRKQNASHLTQFLTNDASILDVNVNINFNDAEIQIEKDEAVDAA